MIKKVNPLRHMELFSPDTFKKRIDVIGVGATGSRIVMGLAKLGLENIHIWDFDLVDEHNIANQIYGISDIGHSKVEALSEIVKSATGITVSAHNERVDSSKELGQVIYLLTDSMDSRKEIWQGVRYNLKYDLMIETRMGIDSGRIYTINPSLRSHILKWEETLCESSETETSACGTKTTVGQTAEIVSGLAVWQLIRWHRINQRKEEDSIDNEVIFSTRPPIFMTRKF